MSIIRWCAVVTLTLICSLGIAQEITVLNLVTGESIIGASVILTNREGEDRLLITNAVGRTNAGVLPASTRIVVSAIGYTMEELTLDQLQASGFVVRLIEKAIDLDEIIVSAARFEEAAKDVAQQVHVISSKDIIFQSQQTSADLLMQSGNVLVQKSQQGGGSPVLRGFEANKVLIVIDGVRMNNAIYRGGHLQNIITLDQSCMDKVEVLLGPGSVIYGSDALGGVMHFYTKTPAFSNDGTRVSGNAFVRTATANLESTGHFDFTVAGKRWTSFTSATFSKFEDLRAGDLRAPNQDEFGRRSWFVSRIQGKDSVLVNPDRNVQLQSGYSQWDFLQKLSFLQKQGVVHTLNAQYSSSTDVPRYDRLTEGSFGAPTFAEWYYGPQDRMFVSYKLDLTNKRTLWDKARVVAAWQQIEESRYSRRFGSSNLSNRLENVAVYSVNADFEKTWKKHELRYGAEWVYNDVQSEAWRTNVNTGARSFLNTRYPDGGSNMQHAALYLSDTWEWRKWLTVSAGVRYSNVSLNARIDSTDISIPLVSANDTTAAFFLNNQTIAQNNQALNGQLGLIFRAPKNWTFRLLYSSGFRAPNVDDVGKLFDPPAAGLLLPNPDLRPEYTHNLDVGVEKKTSDGLYFRFTGYYTWIRRAITIEEASFSGANGLVYDEALLPTFTNTNKDKAYIFGGQAMVRINAGERWVLQSSLNVQQGRIQTTGEDTPLDHIPPTFGRTALLWKAKNMQGEVWAMYNGWKRIQDFRLNTEDNEEYATADGMPAWYTLNIRLQFFLPRNASLQIACENVLNHHYRVFASGISGAGRNLMLTWRLGF
jgi:hemoglobin/transferrin/lactoferrin receptor protein